MTRETITITIAEHTFEVKSYASARETKAIQDAYFSGMKVEVVGQQPTISAFDPKVEYIVKLELIRQLVVSMDGSTDDIILRCEDMRNEDFQDLTARLDEQIGKKKT